MADILASSFKKVFLLPFFGVTLFPVGIGVSVLNFNGGNISSNSLSLSSCCTHCCLFLALGPQGTSLSDDRKKRVTSFLVFFINNTFLFDQFIYCTLNQVTGSVFYKNLVTAELSGRFFFSLDLSGANNTFDFKLETTNNPLSSSSDISPSETIESLSRAEPMSFSRARLIVNGINKIFNNLY